MTWKPVYSKLYSEKSGFKTPCRIQPPYYTYTNIYAHCLKKYIYKYFDKYIPRL